MEKLAQEKIAISASSNILTLTLNRSGGLEQKVPVVVIYPNQNEMDLYRKSTRVPGKYSLEKYTISPLQRVGKDDNKYEFPPLMPNDAFVYYMSNVQFSSVIFQKPPFLTELAQKFNLKLDRDAIEQPTVISPGKAL